MTTKSSEIPVLPLLAYLTFFLLSSCGLSQDFAYTTNKGMITITGYTGPGGPVTIPDAIDRLPVAAIGDAVFKQQFNITSMTLSSNITSIGNWAFAFTSVTNLVIPNSVTNLGDYVAYSCYSLLSLVVPGSVGNIGAFAFSDCTHLGSITLLDGVSSIGTNAFASDNFGSMILPASVTNLAYESFGGCYSLSSLYFKGDAPYADTYAFYSTPRQVTAYYLPGANGWGSTLGANPAMPTGIWLPLQVVTDDGNFGIRTNRFSFTVTGSTNDVVAVDGCTNLADPAWSYVNVLTLSGGAARFTDPRWTNYPGRFYRVRSR